MTAPSSPVPIHGHVSPGFEPLRAAFAENLARRDELGGACCVLHRGEEVVHLWGGVRDRDSGAPWEEGTMGLLYSATKGLAAMTVALAHSRGWLDYDERVSAYWPEFAQRGKEGITVRQLLAHQAGLFAIDEPVDRDTLADLDRMAEILARQRPAWPPGERQAYHALSLGFYEGELLRRVDPGGRSLGRIFQEEIAAPLALDAYIRIPAALPDERLATLAKPSPWKMLFGYPPGIVLASLNPRAKLHRALMVNPGSEVVHDPDTVYLREVEIPSGGGVASARGLARAYGAFAAGGAALGLRPETLAALAAPAQPARQGFFDECMRGEVRFSLGFMKPSPEWPFGAETSCGAPGSGGSLGYADPTNQIGYGYVTSRMGTALAGDPRDVALREALAAALDGLG